MISYELLQQHPIFKDFSKEEVHIIAQYFQFTQKHYGKNTYIFLEGDEILTFGILLKGRIVFEKSDDNGNVHILSSVEENGIFGATCINDTNPFAAFNYKASTDCTVFLFPLHLITHENGNDIPYMGRFLYNLTNLIAKNNRYLMYRLEVLSQRTIRNKVLTLLTVLKRNRLLLGIQSPSNTNQPDIYEFHIPFNHSELADYLCVNRSALERELTHMKKEGILSFEKNTFYVSDSIF